MKRKMLMGMGVIALLLAVLATAFITNVPDTHAAPAVAYKASTKLTHAQAAKMLRDAGIKISSSGNCSNRNNPKCTSLEQIRRTTINGIIAFKKKNRCSVTVTGGTEKGHAGGTYSHWNGYKVDISLNSCVDKYIKRNFKYKGKRGDGAAMYADSRGNIYAKERNHWDILYYK